MDTLEQKTSRMEDNISKVKRQMTMLRPSCKKLNIHVLPNIIAHVTFKLWREEPNISMEH